MYLNMPIYHEKGSIELNLQSENKFKAKIAHFQYRKTQNNRKQKTHCILSGAIFWKRCKQAN